VRRFIVGEVASRPQTGALKQAFNGLTEVGPGDAMKRLNGRFGRRVKVKTQAALPWRR